MASRDKPLPVWLQTNAWREIFARVFEGLKTELNISPEWLVNPATNRRLKLDFFYPEISVAVRFEGLQGKQRRQRPSLGEEVQQMTRDNARVELCRANGVELIVVDTLEDNPPLVFKSIDLSLSRAGAQTLPPKFITIIKQARATAASIARRIHTSKDLKMYADLWEDRQYKIAESCQQTVPPVLHPPHFREGMEVEHSTFGPGVVLTVSPNNGDTLLTVDFITAGQKTLMASLVGDKLVQR